VIPLWVSRYVFLLRVPDVSRPVQEIADFVSGMLLGTLIAMCFRLWAFKRFVFPHAQARPRPDRRRTRPGPRSGAVVQHERGTAAQHERGTAAQHERGTAAQHERGGSAVPAARQERGGKPAAR
jgi:hypothetical protein